MYRASLGANRTSDAQLVAAQLGLTSSLTMCISGATMPGRSRVPTLSRKELLILELLVEHGHLYGLELVAASRRELKRGTVYVTLGRMEDKGYITSWLEEAPPRVGGMPRRLYRATPLGRRVLTAWTAMARQLVPRLAR